MRRLTIGFAAAMMFVRGVSGAQTPDPASTVPTIVTSGDATVSRPPDVAYLTLAVESRARTPREAQAMNAAAMSRVQAQVTAAGVLKEALRTMGVGLEQEFDTQNGRRVPRDFVARNTLEVRIDDVARAGELADAVVQGGATALNGIRFDLKDRRGAEREALRQAVADARSRADAAATGAGRTVDRIVKIEDNRVETVPSPRVFAMRADATAAQSTPVEPGLIEIRARVALTVTMK